MNKNKIIGWFFVAISVWWFSIGVKGIFMQMDCVKNMSPDFPVCGVLPPEIGGVFFSVIPLFVGILFLNKKNKSVE